MSFGSLCMRVISEKGEQTKCDRPRVLVAAQAFLSRKVRWLAKSPGREQVVKETDRCAQLLA